MMKYSGITTLACAPDDYSSSLPESLRKSYTDASLRSQWAVESFSEVMSETAPLPGVRIRQEFRRVAHFMRERLGEPAGVAILGGAAVGITRWESLTVEDQARALWESTGAFEASAMAYYRARGKNAADLLGFMCPRVIDKEINVGKAAFVVFTTPCGTVDDEAVCIRLSEEEYLLSCGGCKRLSFIDAARARFPDVEFEELTGWASFNLKGPKKMQSAQALVRKEDAAVVGSTKPLSFCRVRPAWPNVEGDDGASCREEEEVIVVRSKIGYEFWGPVETLLGAWDVICDEEKRREHAITPCGWDVLHSYRMDCDAICFALYPLDIHCGTNLRDVGFGYMCRKEKAGPWLGSSRLLSATADATAMLVLMSSEDEKSKPARVGDIVVASSVTSLDPQRTVGVITSAGFSLKKRKQMAFAHFVPLSNDDAARFSYYVGSPHTTGESSSFEWHIEKLYT